MTDINEKKNDKILRVYGIYAEEYKSSVNDFIVKGRYDAVPAVFLSDGNKTEKIYFNKPFKIFEKNMDLELVKNIVSQYEDNIQFLQTAGEAYKKLTRVVNKNLEKIIADMISTCIVRKIKEYPKDELIFFITNLTSEKIIGRLGYLFLDYSNVTIAFVTYKSKELMTNIINKNYLDFDLTYTFENNSIAGNIDPDSSSQSMLATFFYKIPLKTERHISPLRVDIFAQNLSIDKITNKKNSIENYLSNAKNLSEPIIDKETDDYVIRLPKPLQLAIESNENFKHIAGGIINQRRDNK